MRGKCWRFGDDVNTDDIIPGRYLNMTDGLALAEHCMEDVAPEFARKAVAGDIIVAGRNFGCGSSREHAPWALLDFGIRCVIAPGFADIFFNNCFKNGVLPIVLPRDQIDALMEDAGQGANATFTIDLEAETITRPDGSTLPFEVDPFRKHCLLEGLDDIGLTLEKNTGIAGYEESQRRDRPWLWG